MCGITFRKIDTLKMMLETQATRGLDGIGLVYKEMGLTRIKKIFVEKDYKHWTESGPSQEAPQRYFFNDNREYSFPRLEEFYQDILELLTMNMNKQEYIFAHHRKGTVGSNGISNTHPFETDKFILAQNGTDRRIHEWGIVEGVDPDKADTFVLLKYLDMHCNTLQECLDRIKILISRKIVIGTIMIFSKAENKMMIFADGERSLYVSKTPEGKIDYIQSRKDDTHVDLKTKGYIVFDFEGTVFVEEFQNLNEEKVVYTKPATTPTNFYGSAGNQQMIGSRSGYKDIHTDQFTDFGSEYWAWGSGEDEGGFQNIGPDVKDVNEIEDENQWISYLPITDVMEFLDDLDEKRYRELKKLVALGVSTHEEETELLQIVIYIQTLIKRGIELTEKTIKDAEQIRTVLMDIGRNDIHTKEREKLINNAKLTLMQLNAYKDIYHL